MVIEYIRYDVHASRAAEFQQAYKAASTVLDADAHCLGYEIAQGVEEPEHFVVRIEWDSVRGHEQDFRGSAGFKQFFEAVRPFFNEIQEMKHYEIRQGGLVR